MAASPTPRTADPPLIIAVAVSGGRDSTALLHCLAHAALLLGVQVHALHVHHGLMADADRWVEHLQAQVGRWTRRGLAIKLHVHRLSAKPQPGDSIEAWARKHRYAALADMARVAGAAIVLLGHHRQDQAETVLLQALRGAGARGLSAMPRRADRHGITWLRPWLDHPRRAIDAYLKRYRIGYIDDQSNHDSRYARSRLRRELWPTLVAAFPDAESSLCLVARRAQENAACLSDLATIDLATCAAGVQLSVGAWSTLSPARRVLALRVWLARQELGALPEGLVQRLAEALMHVRSATWQWQQRSLRLYRGVLSLAPELLRSQTAPAPVRIDLSRHGAYRIDGWPGTLVVQAGTGPALAAADLTTAECHSRRGGERFQLRPGRPPRSLKKQYQQAGIASWWRDGPLVYVQGQLAFVPGLGLDARACKAPAGEGVTLHWWPEPERPPQ